MAVPELIGSITMQFLVGYAPFARMESADLRYLAEHVRLAYFPTGAVISDPDANDPGQLQIIQRGHVRAQRGSSAGSCVVLGPGECFPLLNLSADASATFTANEDVFCYQLAGEQVLELRRRSVAFQDFYSGTLSEVVKDSLTGLHSRFLRLAVAPDMLLKPLSALLRREPVVCTAATPVREALTRMSCAGVGTIIIVDEARRPLGIFTLTDLMERVVLQDRSLTTPVGAFMTADPGSLEDCASTQEAMSLMATKGFHQVLVTRDQVLIGVISERDLFALQRVSIRNVLQAIRAAGDATQLRSAVEDIAVLTDNLLAQGVSPEHLTRIITALHDGLNQRLLELLAPRFSLGDIRWCWLALGSEGRRELTVVSDQDNALLFKADGEDAAAVRARLLPFCRAVNQALADLGIPLCSGNIMAGNPECCLSESEWRVRFDAWLREPTPEALLNANIFFDFRPLAGAADMAEELRSWVLARTGESRLFLGLLIDNARRADPPLGLIRAFRTDDAEFPGTLDLKTHGTRLFVDAARVFALAFGVSETHTVQRLRQGARRLNLPERDLAGLVQAFEFLQLLRFRVQRGGMDTERAARATAGGSNAAADLNRIDPYALSDPDQRLLKEAFRQARQLQALLEQFIAH